MQGRNWKRRGVWKKVLLMMPERLVYNHDDRIKVMMVINTDKELRSALSAAYIVSPRACHQMFEAIADGILKGTMQ